MRLFIVLLFYTGFSFAQISVPQTQKAFYGIFEATWCGICGQYGHPYTESIITNTSPKAVYVSLHQSTSSALYSSVAAELATAFGVSGQPIFTLDGVNLGPHSPTMVGNVTNAINAFYSTAGADVNGGFEYGIVDDTLYVHTTTRFFENVNGEYYLGVYVYEDSIWEWQANYDPGIADMNIWQNHVFRTSMNGAFGTLVESGSIASGTEVNRNFKKALDPSWNQAQLHVFTVIWKKNAGASSGYDFVNTNDVGAVITGYSGITEGVADYPFFYPNPAHDRVNIIGLPATEFKVSIYDLTGSLVCMYSQENILSLEGLNPGIYLFNLAWEGHTRVERIVVY